ncbi:neutral/alkaline non-lysosomal ceramidase N-terminal domain-containing protein [Pedobacter sp. MC2016-24]|uniref:neutral/alkaline non-lysosomal ceramidase N-terminal domain-containing protein n=1 Tax=Pedobacter sp. MC2016-24 TaxID=2780090 RepID=UPI0018808E3B|nr:neutral/alkaline non-lysosomal ceramidase N-terminal domain-containing protein [Pedobacter sp. MC2016-24]MBE9598066.1 neutral/alkaline non-lysosomal ceramidase N-terminal domain-containing protein [Pedobacter sp. MC2016-24]
MTFDPSFAGIIGVAQEDVTPPSGIYARNWGAAKHDVAEGIHRALKLTCMTFQDHQSASPMVLVSLDLGWWKSAADEKELRSSILKALNLEPSHLMLCLSHTHAGPGLFSEDASKPGGQYIIPYLKYIQVQAISAIQKALAVASVSTLSWRYGKCALATNRDLKDLTADRLLVGYNPELEADDTLLVGRVTNSSGQITGVIVNYACHPTTLAWDNRLISPDYVGAMRELLEESTAAPCLFLQGASGDLAPAEQYSGDCQLADRYGRQLGHAALAVLEAMYAPDNVLVLDKVVESGAPLAVWKGEHQPSSGSLGVQMIHIPLVLKSLPSLSEIERDWRACEDHVLKERLWRMRGIRKTVGEGDVSDMPLWIWRLGSACLIGQPNEAYSWFQQELREQLKPATVAVMNIVNGYAGYLPPRKLYTKNMYAIWQTPFAEGSLEQLTAAATAAAKMIMK